MSSIDEKSTAMLTALNAYLTGFTRDTYPEDLGNSFGEHEAYLALDEAQQRANITSLVEALVAADGNGYTFPILLDVVSNGMWWVVSAVERFGNGVEAEVERLYSNYPNGTPLYTGEERVQALVYAAYLLQVHQVWKIAAGVDPDYPPFTADDIEELKAAFLGGNDD